MIENERNVIVTSSFTTHKGIKFSESMSMREICEKLQSTTLMQIFIVRQNSSFIVNDFSKTHPEF